jgi:hypothetical protein
MVTLIVLILIFIDVGRGPVIHNQNISFFICGLLFAAAGWIKFFDILDNKSCK